MGQTLQLRVPSILLSAIRTEGYNKNMQPSIFGKKLDDVEFSDVVAFCAPQPVESQGLDYKKDLSSLEKVVKTLVSFANTNGGWVIVGVEDDGNDKPKLPVTGMPFSSDLEQKVTNSIVSSVSPIVIPYYKVCVPADGKTAFLIAYMPQSSTAPHWMLYKKKYQLFVRHSDRAAGDDWDNTATPNQWEVLRNRRQLSIGLRDQLAANMKQIFEVKATELMEARDEIELKERRSDSPFGMAMATAIPMRTYFGGEEYEGSQTISIFPAYPTSQVVDVPTIEEIFTYEPVRNAYNAVHAQTPDTRGYDTRIYQNGVYITHQDERTKNLYFFGVDVFGNIMNVDPIQILHERDVSGGSDHISEAVVLDRVIGEIVNVLKFAEKTYARIGLLGNLNFRAEFSGSRGCVMLPNQIPLPFFEDNLYRNITGEYVVQRELDTNVLSDKEARRELILGIVKEIMYSFNMSGFDEALLVEFIAKSDIQLTK